MAQDEHPTVSRPTDTLADFFQVQIVTRFLSSCASIYLAAWSLSGSLPQQAVPSDRALDNLEKADQAWRRLCESERMPFKEVLTESSAPMKEPCLQAFDVVVLGGG